jgi:hypothetical protein
LLQAASDFAFWNFQKTSSALIECEVEANFDYLTYFDLSFVIIIINNKNS